MANFYIVSAGASATLVGLLFVAVQFGPPLNQSRTVGRRLAIARSTFTIFVILFALSLFLLLPGTSLREQALVVGAASVGGSWRAIRTWLPVWRDKLHGQIEFRLWETAWLLIGPLLVYVYMAVETLLNLQSGSHVRAATGNGFILLFVIALRNSWNLLVEASGSSQE